MTDQEKLAALRSVFKTGRVMVDHRGALIDAGLIEYVGLGLDPFEHGHHLLTPKGIAEAERLGAADPDTQRLRVWKNRIVEWVIAETPEDATKRLRIHFCEIGEPFAELDTSWTECPADKPLTMDCDDVDRKFTRLPAQWAALQGPGFLGSTEY
jgi:hypothetical protein